MLLIAGAVCIVLIIVAIRSMNSPSEFSDGPFRQAMKKSKEEQDDEESAHKGE